VFQSVVGPTNGVVKARGSCMYSKAKKPHHSYVQPNHISASTNFVKSVCISASYCILSLIPNCFPW
jgi:hypothetical protein